MTTSPTTKTSVYGIQEYAWPYLKNIVELRKGAALTEAELKWWSSTGLKHLCSLCYYIPLVQLNRTDSVLLAFLPENTFTVLASWESKYRETNLKPAVKFDPHQLVLGYLREFGVRSLVNLSKIRPTILEDLTSALREVEDDESDDDEDYEGDEEYLASQKLSFLENLEKLKFPVSSHFKAWVSQPETTLSRVADNFTTFVLSLKSCSPEQTTKNLSGLISRILVSNKTLLVVEKSASVPAWLQKAFDEENTVLVPDPQLLIETEPDASTFNRDFEEIIDWFKGLKDQSSIKGLSWSACVAKHKEWLKEMNEKTSLAVLDSCPVVLTLEKYSVVQLLTKDALAQEGKLMEHCIKGPEFWRLCNGMSHVYFSVRDNKTKKPVLTIEAHPIVLMRKSVEQDPLTGLPQDGPTLRHAMIASQVKGRANHTPIKYAALVFEIEHKLGLYNAVDEYGYSIMSNIKNSVPTSTQVDYKGTTFLLFEGEHLSVPHPEWTTDTFAWVPVSLMVKELARRPNEDVKDESDDDEDDDHECHEGEEDDDEDEDDPL